MRLLNERNPDDDSSNTAHARQVVLPDSPEDDRLRVELVPAFASTLPPQKKPDLSVARPFRAPRKRKQNTSEAAVVESSGDESGRKGNGWRVVSGWKEIVKRVKNSLVRKPVEITLAEPQLSGHDSVSMQLSTTTSIPKIS
jgi:hypothetical protein